jgi:hypothetical protein
LCAYVVSMEVELEISWDDLVSIEPLGNVALRVLNLMLEVMKVLSDNIPFKQCSGSVCFWASRIRNGSTSKKTED